MECLYEKLLEYQKSDAYPFHMPGHKRNMKDFVNPFFIDITEIYGFDNLHHAEGVLEEAQKRASKLYRSEKTYFLVNGSTCGVLSAVSACTKRGGKILMARNSHKAAYHAALLRELDIVYLYPEREEFFGLNGGISPDEVKRRLEKDSSIQAVFITSPTYDGVVSDVKKIAEYAHEKGIPLIVDEAHGAHFGFHSYFPESSVKLGADLVIHSLHKTLPSLTQTALLHLNGNLVDRESLQMYLSIYQSSSPSYVFMAAMDRCVEMIEKRGWELFEGLKRELDFFYDRAKKLQYIYAANVEMAGRYAIYDFDPSKLVLSVKKAGLQGNWLETVLRDEYHLELEMAGGTYALALTSVNDTQEGFRRLWNALEEIDLAIGRIKEEDEKIIFEEDDMVSRNEKAYRICDALERKGRSILFEESEGYVSREFLYLYPPGIPLLVPGERISRNILDQVRWMKKEGYSFQGMSDYSNERIQIVEE